MNFSKISACLVVHNEAAVIEHCLQSLTGLVDEIIVVHDGPCTDATLEIARRYTNKIFVRDFVGEAEPHRAFSFKQASNEWIIQIDADEYFDLADHGAIRALTLDSSIDGYFFQWEFWNEKRAIHLPGLQKMCLFRRQAVSYIGVPHLSVQTKIGRMAVTLLTLHHRPAYNNIAWRSFLRKAKRWVPVHAKYFLPNAPIETYNADVNLWYDLSAKVRAAPLRNLAWVPLKNFLGQLSSGRWQLWYGWQVAAQQYVYYAYLYWCVWQKSKAENTLIFKEK